MKDVRESIAALVSEHSSGIDEARMSWASASAQHVVTAMQSGFCAGALLGCIAVPAAVARNGAPRGQLGSLGSLGRYAFAGAFFSAAAAVYRVSISDEKRVVARARDDARGGAAGTQESRARLGAAFGAVAGAALAKKAMMKGALGGAAAGCVAGLCYHAYDAHLKPQGYIVRLHYEPQAFDKAFNQAMGSVKRNIDALTGKL